MKKLFLLAWPIALAAVSCSNEEVVSVNNDANEITFTAVAENATRAFTDSMYCNNWKPGSFHVWALAKDANTTVVGKTSYFQEVRYDANAGKSLWSAADKANIRFWPNEGASLLDFYVMHNYKGDGTTKSTVNWTPTATGETAARLAVTGYELTTDVAKQQDFIYAVLQNQAKPDNVGTVGINFRHALSQVVFKARNTNKTLHVEIGEVYVKNFYNKGNFALPVKDTKDNIGVHADPVKTDPADKTVGTWTIVTPASKVSTTHVAVYPTVDSEGNKTAAKQDYAVVKYTANSSEATNLTDGVDTGVKATRDFTKAMLFIPQTLTKVETVPSGENAVANDPTNPYFVIKCKIWNVDGGANGTADFNAETDVCIYDGYAYIPVEATWEAGKKYIYTFVFGGKNGGYDENGKDVLVPISFTVTVDDFTPIVEEDVNMFQ